MKRVTGIGGIFFQAADPALLHAWYAKHLGIEVQAWGGTAFSWSDEQGTPLGGTTVWSIGKANVDSPAPGFTINYRVDNLAEVVAGLRSEGITVTDEVNDPDFGSFARLADPEGNKIELWQPPAGK